MQYLIEQMPPPAIYRPYMDGRFTVRPGLRPLGKDFGNGPRDNEVIQIDHQFPRYRQNKEQARERGLKRYHGYHNYSDAVRNAVTNVLVNTLLTEHPDLFHYETRNHALSALLTGETVYLPPSCSTAHPFENALDAIAMQIQEDIAVVSVSQNNWVSAVHVTAPNYWTPADKLGESFIEVHEPVPNMDDTPKKIQNMIAGIVRGGRYVRFVWGLAPDDDLDHVDEPICENRTYHPTRNEFYIRVERQVLLGLPEASAIVFFIRTYIRPVAELSPEECRALASGLRSMTPEQQAYKGVDRDHQALVAALEGRAAR